MSILLKNSYNCYYETIEFIINKINFIVKNDVTNYDIYLKLTYDNISFIKYIINKFPKIKIIDNIDKKFNYYIECIYYCNNLIIQDSKHFYISRNFNSESLKLNNVYYLSELSRSENYLNCDVLPYCNDRNFTYTNNSIPIYIVIGCIFEKGINLLLEILNDVKNDYIIKILSPQDLPETLTKDSRIVQVENLDFEKYHKQFLDCYCIITLSDYQIETLINYSKCYKINIILNDDLKNMYNCERNFWDCENDIVYAFENSLFNFCENRNNDLYDDAVVKNYLK